MDENKTKAQIVESQGQALAPLEMAMSPQKIMDNAISAAKVLQEIVAHSKKKSIIVVNGQEYLMFPAWQTIGEFYGYTAQIEWTKKLEKDGEFVGYEAKAVLINLRTGKTFPGAEALCLAVEQNWKGKPEFTLKSMAQTRACSKTLSNRFRWVATLAGYEGTPGEEIADATVGGNAATTLVRLASASQIAYIQKGFGWKKINPKEFELGMKKPMEKLTMDEAKILLNVLFNKDKKEEWKNPDLQFLLGLFNASSAEKEPVEEDVVEPDWMEADQA